MNKKLKSHELKRKSMEEYKLADKAPIILLLDNVRSLHNVGSIFRSADAFLVHTIYLTGYTPTPPHRDIHKTALGATESVQWKYARQATDAIKDLKQEGWTIASLEQTEQSIALSEFLPEKGRKYVFLLGNEVEGVGQHLIDLSDLCIEIPQYGTKHSLNISVCAGLLLWDITNKL